MNLAIKDHLWYDVVSGNLHWLTKSRGRKCGGVAGSIKHDGNMKYVKINFCGKTYLAHRLAWFLYYGELPEMDIDHIDRNGTNNRITNLRLATNSQNQQNREDIDGVYFQCGKWVARISDRGSRIHIGRYETRPEATQARKEYENRIGWNAF